MTCECDNWAREYQPETPREPHHKFCPQYGPRLAESNPFVRDCPRCVTPGECCRLCGGILGETVTYDGPTIPVTDNWHVDPEGQLP